MSETTYRRVRNLMESDFADELVALDPARGACFGFNSSATSVWRILSEPQTLAEICDQLQREYDVDAATCLRELPPLLADMRANGLIE